MFNVATILCALTLVPLMLAFRAAADRGDRDRHRDRRTRADRAAVAVAAPGRLPLPPDRWISETRHLREVLRLMGPGTLGLAAVQINVFVNTYLATGQEQGRGFLAELCVSADVPADWPVRRLDRHGGAAGDRAPRAAADERAGIRRTVSGALRMMFMLNVPATVGLIALANPIVALLLERGQFTAQDTAATAAALMFYAPGLLGYSAVKIASPSSIPCATAGRRSSSACYRYSPTWRSTWCSCARWDIGGLALGTALAAMFNAVTLLWLLRNRSADSRADALPLAFVKILVASIVMGVAARLSIGWLARMLAGIHFTPSRPSGLARRSRSAWPCSSRRRACCASRNSTRHSPACCAALCGPAA